MLVKIQRAILGYLLFICIDGFSQSAYRSVPAAYTANLYTNYDNTKSTRFRSAVNATSYLPKNYSTQGNVDYTKYLQNAINENTQLIMPDFPVLVNATGLRLRSNNKLLFQKNSKLIIAPNAEQGYSALLAENISDVEIYYAHIIGDKNQHLTTKGEWGMGISLVSSRNISIYAPQISECWGDGIYIGSGSTSTVSENVTIENGFLDNNRRNGISIVGGKNITVNRVTISNTSGADPESGIDIEPNTNDETLEGIHLLNITTFNNTNHGIMLVLDHLIGSKKQDIAVNVDNHTDYYSKIGMGLFFDRGYRKQADNFLNGKVAINNATYVNSGQSPFVSYKGKKHNINVTLNNLKIVNKNSTKTLRTFRNMENDIKKGVQIKLN